MRNDHKLHKITFVLPPGEWHGVAQETLWCEDMEHDRYRLHNTPFFITGLSYDDIVATEIRNGVACFKSVLVRGGHSTYRILYDKSIDRNTLQSSLQNIQALDCSYEAGMDLGSLKLLAIDVHPKADIRAIWQALKNGEAKGIWDFEEGHCEHRV